VDVGILNKFEWRYLIVDEGHRLKNKSAKLLKAMQTLNCDRRLLLTGTPIQNTTAELYTLLNFIDPKRFHSENQFQAAFGDLQESRQVAELQEAIRPYVLRRMKESVVRFAMLRCCCAVL